ncbi:formimidoylglutamate deiminase [Phenylobacterium sp.]|uniref:formimidoylglutamate deiminase n=1 Tax=Phenylobacterium sp. TaxID=1871053 RepID=UPI00301BAFF1
MTRAHFFFDQALLPTGWARGVRMEVDDGIIAAVDAGAAIRPGDLRHGVALPGLCNLHSHAFQRGMAGLAEIRGPAGDTFWTWREVMYRFLDRLDPDMVEAIADLAFAEMLEAGFTRVGEFHYLHQAPDGAPYDNPAELTDRIVAAASDTGIGLTLLPVFYAHSDFGGAPPKPGQRRFIHTLDSFSRLLDASRVAARRLPDARVGIAPHSLRAVTPDELAVLLDAAGDAPVHIHAAEQDKEVSDCVAALGARPVEWLIANAAVDARWCLVHATQMTAAETRALALSGAVAGLCPVTEANLGDGVFASEAYLTAGGRFGLGTDSNIHIDAAMELRSLEYAQRLSTKGRNVLADAPGASTGVSLFQKALAGGAQALATDAGLAPGAPADFLTLDENHPSLFNRHGDALLDSWVFAAGREAVDGVWRRGRQVVRDGRHVRRAEFVERYRLALRRLLD